MSPRTRAHRHTPRASCGGWLSLYDSYSTDGPDELEIDHVVALAETWDSGADSWDAARREAFANDLEHPGALRKSPPPRTARRATVTRPNGNAST
jgi:hypothetical protein